MYELPPPPSERHVIFGRWAVWFRHGRRFGGGGRRLGRGTGTRRSRGGRSFAGPGAAEKLHDFCDDPQFAAFLAGLFVIPLIETKPAFNENRAAFAHILADVFSGAPENVHIDKGDFLLLFAGFGRPDPVDREATFGDGHSFGSVAQLRIAGHVPDENDFVETGHG